eukprot:Seg1670.13 transcript_id=Seg1670.13/GoldUCD/mRNA.D3Y31 product="hypothetical protein" protein_id=Seg1670.13/GoldUCD/D3Y31
MEFSLEDLFAEPPPKISGRSKKEEGNQCQTSSKDGSGGRYSPLKADSRHAVNVLSPAKTISKFQQKQGESKQCNTSCKGGSESHYSPLKESNNDTVKTPVTEGHVFSPAKTLSKFQPQQQEHQKNLDSDSGSLDDLFVEPPQKASVKVTCLSTNHNGNLDKEENNMPLVEHQKGKMALHHEARLVQSKTEVANASKGTAQVQLGHKFENVAKLNICESKLQQNDNKTKSDASPTNVISSSSSLSSDKKNLHCSKMNENLKEKSQIIIEDQKNSEENVPKKVKQASSYHVPSLEEILGKSLMTANIAKRTSFSTDDEPTFFKKPRKERMLHMQHGKVISDPNKNDSTCTKLIKDGSVERPTINEEFKKHFLEKKRPKDIQKVKVTEYDGHAENQFIISKQQIEEDAISVNISKKKAGNYLRKLHTKCRVSRKEIQMLETKTVDDESDFFGEVVERPEIAKSQQNTEITEYPYISFKKDIFAEGQVIVKSAAQKRKERKNKKRKAKKKRNKLKGGNIDANSQNNDDDDDDDDDMILLPRKDTKPHKWPVRTKSVEQQNLQLETELGLKKETSPKNDQSQRELMNENMTNRKEIVIKKKLESAPAPSLLDEIISQSAMLYPSCLKQSLQQSKIKTQTKLDSTNNSNAQPKTLLTPDSAGVSKIKLDENLKAIKDLNKIEMNEWWKEENLEESKKVLDKQDFAENMQKHVKQHSLAVDSCKQLSGSHHISEKAAKVAAEGKHQENVIFHEKIDSCVEYSLMKNSITGDGINDIPMKEIRNQELEEKSLLNIAIENARKEASKTNSTNAKEESLLSLVKDVPLDLTVIDKEEMETTSKERSKRGGKKRKRRANKGVKGSSKGQQNKRPKMEIDTKPKVKCKYFLDGKCRMLLARDETRKLEIERPENSEEAEDNTGELATEELVGEDPVVSMPKLYESLI